MSKFVKENLKEIAISGIRQFNQKADLVEDVIKLTLGEPDFNVDDKIKEAVKEALENNKTRYTLNAGIEDLRKEISLKYPLYHEDEVIITVGTTEALATIIKSIISPGDEVIIPTPAYVGYEPLILLDGGIVKTFDLIDNNKSITKEVLDSLYTEKTKALIITNPSNPTGLVLTTQEMDDIKDFVLEKDILLISDEVYSEIDYSNTFTSFSNYLELKENIVCVNGFSKSHAMTGFRIGYMVGDLLLMKHLLKTHQYSVTSASSISQYAALRAFTLPNQHMVDILRERRSYVMSRLDQMGLSYIKPMAGFYIFVKISDYSKSSIAFCEKLLYIGKLACIPGESFLGNHKDYIRISYALDIKELEKALDRLKAFIQKV
jgi:aminotransferase